MFNIRRRSGAKCRVGIKVWLGWDKINVFSRKKDMKVSKRWTIVILPSPHITHELIHISWTGMRSTWWLERVRGVVN